MAGEQIRIDPNRFGGPSNPRKEQLELQGKEATIGSSVQSAASSRAAEQRARAEFILKHGIAPEDVQQTKTVPGDPTKTGEEYLATIKDRGLVNRIRMLAEGRMSWPTGAALRNPAMAELIAAASIYDPTLDEANAKTRFATRKDFTSGVSARNLTAINTAMGHLADLKKLAIRLNNSNYPDLNRFINSIQANRLGDPRVNDYRTAADAFASELAKTFKGGTPALAEIEDWKARTNENMSPAQFQGFVDTAAKLLNSRIEAVGDQYNRGMGKSSDPLNLLSPHARKLYETIGVPLEKTSLEEDNTVDPLASPEGKQIAGEDVKGFRFSPESEAALSAYASQLGAKSEVYAQMLADAAIKENFIKPSDREDYIQKATAANQKFFEQPPEVRANASNLSYDQIDRAASENAGLVEGIAQTIKNAPESAYNLGTGLIAPVTDLARSINSGEREGIYDLVPNLLMGDDETVSALGNVVSDRYGSVGKANRTLITDPFGYLADVSLPVTLAGAAASRLPGAASNAGRVISAGGKLFDPMSATTGLLTEAAPSIFSTLKNRYGINRIGDKGADLLAETAGFRSGAGGPALREGFEAGMTKPIGGKSTPASSSYTKNMRDAQANIGDIVAVAKNAVRNLRNIASEQYKTRMAEFGLDPTPLSPDSLRQALADMRPENYDAFIGAPHRPSDHIAWQQMNDTVEHYLGQAAKDPSLLSPLAVDQFKQDLYTIGSKIGNATDRDAARIAGNTYQSVRQMLVNHDPIYAEIMQPYAKAAQEAAELESGFSIGSKRTKPINTDTAARKLLSSMRNNAHTNYGQRAAQVDRLAELDPAGTLKPSLAGQTVSSWVPRGIRAGIEAAAAALYGGGHAAAGNPFAMMDPTVWGVMAGASPRVAGELSYGAGRLVGTAQKYGSAAGKNLLDLYEKYPTTALSIAQTGKYADETEAERLRRIYGMPNPIVLDPSEAE